MVKLRRISTPEAVVNYFRDQIRSGALKPGEPLPSERVLIGRMGISRLSLREGLARLTALGIIRTRHGKGASVSVSVNSESLSDALLPIVSDPSSRTFRDLLDARIVIEAEVGARAARNRTEEDVATLAGILQDCENLLDDAAAFGRLDLQFHRETARIANNAVLAEIHSMVLRSVEQFVLDNVRTPETRRNAHEDHLRICAGIRDGLEEQVRADVRVHIGTCVARYEELFTARPTAGPEDPPAVANFAHP
jgi:GntR family transcriptional regulator, transcriptional repressor for pyruvate dehydrogenase complex